jgi:hypothetical protein
MASNGIIFVKISQVFQKFSREGLVHTRGRTQARTHAHTQLGDSKAYFKNICELKMGTISV